MDKIINLAERFYPRLYASDARPGETTESTSSTCDVLLLTEEEVGKAFKGMTIEKSAGDDVVNVDLLKEGGYIVQENLSVQLSECLKVRKVSIASKNAIIIVIHKKEDPKDLKNCRPMSLL